MSPAQEYVLRNLQWRLRGYVDGQDTPVVPPGGGETPPTRRTDYGQYEPSTDQAGIYQGSSLDPYTPPGGVWKITQENAVIKNFEVFGRVKPEAKNIKFENCLVHGLSSGQLVNGSHQPLGDNISSLTNGGAPTLYLDCTFMPQAATGGVDGMKGGNYTAERCVVAGVDGFKSYTRNVTIKGCMVPRLFWVSNDAEQGPEGSHTDGVQILGGNYTTILGNSFNNGFSPAGSSNIGIQLNNNQGNPIGWAIEYNYFRTKLSNGTRVGNPINLGITGVTNFTCRYNRIQLGKNGWHIQARSAILTQTRNEPGNVDLDTGGAIIVANGG